MMLPPPMSTLFPYTTLFRSGAGGAGAVGTRPGPNGRAALSAGAACGGGPHRHGGAAGARHRALGGDHGRGDRKSTRLNSSHLVISYAVFCLKTKTEIRKERY